MTSRHRPSTGLRASDSFNVRAELVEARLASWICRAGSPPLWAAGVAVLWPTAAFACPFCDAGGRDSALFILAFFGFFALGMGAIVYAYGRAGAFKNDLRLERRVLEAEGVSPESEPSPSPSPFQGEGIPSPRRGEG